MPKKSNIKNVDFKETLWKSADKLRNKMDAAEYKHIVLGLIFLKYISDKFYAQRIKISKLLTNPKSDFFINDPKNLEKELEDRDYYTKDNVFWVPPKSRWEKLRAQAKQSNIGSIIDKAMVEIENENKFLRGKLDRRFGKSTLDDAKLGSLIDLISKIGFSNEDNENDMLGEVYEYFLGKFSAAEGKKGGEYFTPNCVVKTLVNIISPYEGRIYDPCCGSGGMFIQSQELIKSHGGKVDDVSIYGQESNPTTWRLAVMNLAIRGFSVDLGKKHSDTFDNDQFLDLKFDYILANPPFNVSDWDGEKHQNDPKWVYGTPPVGNANYAWLQHIIHKLNSKGKAGIVLASGASSSKGIEQDIRRKIIEDDLIEIMISLPSKLFLNSPTTSTMLWILNKNKNVIGETLFIDARPMGKEISRTQVVLEQNEIELITNTTNKWRLRKNYNDIKGFCRSLSLKNIDKSSWSVSPSRYVGIEEENIESAKVEDLVKDYLKLDEESKELEKKLNQNIKNIKDFL
jgi:type I restriction enzyme M protein